MKPWGIMKRGIRFNQFLENRMILVVGSGLLAGALFHDQMVVLKPLVPYLFFYMTFAVAVNCSSADFKKAVKTPGPLLTIIGMLHIALPLLATLLARTLLPGEPLLQAGVILGTAVPIGVASSIWISISGGNAALGLTAVVADTVLSPLVVPAIMLLALGQSVKFDVAQLMIGLAWMIVLPTLLGMGLHDASGGRIHRQYKFVTGPTTKLLLGLVVSINLAVAWDSLHLLRSALAKVLLVVLIMTCSGYLAGYACAKLARKPPQLVNTYLFAIGMRNITAGLVMALKYFPELTAIPVVFAIIFQQPLAAVSHRFLAERPGTSVRSTPLPPAEK
ncbi:putative Na+-dependent transporter [Hydrogenispora ethanolica]|uniref:Putative Na+-dependent transporter n=1 Tax=Hydrogenispora ethanolica TaxID=1082276 RepID=A0A4R1S9K2_HYDET|nr:bile acid:sodium symporter family protein [Hydrogenispora ethanolica]TCL75202.1 putative Na+-dependent transporter [Hydrogenispora ethanolica]